MTSSKARSQRRRRPKAAMTTTRTTLVLSLSFLTDLSQQEHHPVGVVATVSTAANVCNIQHHEGHDGVIAAAAAEYNKMKARGQIVQKGGHYQSWGLLSSKIIAIPRGGGFNGWNKEREKGLPEAKEKEDDTANSGNDDEDDEPAPILSSPFLDSFQQEVHEIVGGYRSDVRRIFQQLKDDILQSREVIDQQDYKPPATKTKSKKRRNRPNRNRGPSKPKDDGATGSKSKKDDKKEEELVRDYPPPLDNDFIMGDTDQDEDEVLERLLFNEADRPSRQHAKNDESSLEKSSKMAGFRDKLDDDGRRAMDEEPPTIEKTPINLWNTVEQEAEAELAVEYQVKASEEQGTAKSGAKKKKEEKIGVPKQPGSLESQRVRRQHQQEDDEYPPLGSSLSRRQGGVDPRVWKALVVSFAFGGLFLILGMAFKILSVALGLNS